MAAGRLNSLLGQAALDDPRNVPIGALPQTTLEWLAGQAGQLWPSPWRDALLASVRHRQVFAAVIDEGSDEDRHHRRGTHRRRHRQAARSRGPRGKAVVQPRPGRTRAACGTPTRRPVP